MSVKHLESLNKLAKRKGNTISLLDARVAYSDNEFKFKATEVNVVQGSGRVGIFADMEQDGGTLYTIVIAMPESIKNGSYPIEPPGNNTDEVWAHIAAESSGYAAKGNLRKLVFDRESKVIEAEFDFKIDDGTVNVSDGRFRVKYV